MSSKFVRPVAASQIPELENEFFAAAMAQAHPKVLQWCGSALETNLRKGSASAVAAVDDEKQAAQFAKAMHVLGLPPESFKGRLIDSDGARLIAAINFRDVSGATPYIRILRSTVPPGAISDWSVLKPCLADAFGEFQPEAVIFSHPAHLPLRAPTTRIEDHLLAAPAGDIANGPRVAGFDRVELRPSVNVEFYPRYKAMYESLYLERPALRGEVRTESKDDLANCLAHGFLFEIFVDGHWAGVLATDRRNVGGVQGVYMIEIVLDQSARGQRLGPAVHQHLAATVAKVDPTEIILGTISAKNSWSRQTALRAGRIEIGAWHWIAL